LFLVPASLVAAQARAAPEPGGLVDEAVPWVRHPTSDLGGTSVQDPIDHIGEDERAEGFWQGDMYFDADSGAASLLAKMGLPIPRGVDYEETPGVLYLNLEGVTLTTGCNNSALNCTGLVGSAGGEATFPPYGDESTRAAILDYVRARYESMDVVVTRDRPPPYLPYVMNVIGGSHSIAGKPSGTCGVAYMACDASKRNYVSLTFPESCGQVAHTACHESAHNFGLEHVTDKGDIMYPVVGSNRSFRDTCMTITTPGSLPIQCGYVHEAYCEAAAGEQQNSHAELLGAFGPRTPDTVAPEIVSISPADGTEFTGEDRFAVTASVNENSSFVGARWTWDEGVPPEMGESYTRCTNEVCDTGYEAFLDPNETEWDFLKLGPDIPEGSYGFTFEVMDAYGNADTKSITVTVKGGSSSGGDTGTTGGGDTAGGGDTGDGGGTGTGSGSDGGGSSSGSGSGEDGSGSGASNGASGSEGSSSDSAEEETEGCGCATSPAAWGGTGLAFIALLALRRRA
jgi:hypothetical protein